MLALKYRGFALALAAISIATGVAIASNVPQSAVFNDPITGAQCGPSGAADSSDPYLNLLKNRIAQPTSVRSTTVAELDALPRHIKQPRSAWSSSDRAEFARYETTAIQVTGYMIGRRPEKAESTNCRAIDAAGVDIHTWIVDDSHQTKTAAAVAEVTPRWRQVNPQWNPAALQALVEQGAEVRISGWAMYDQEHPEQMDPGRKTRSTLWEVHPIAKIEVYTTRGWIELGDPAAIAAIHYSAAHAVQIGAPTAKLMPMSLALTLPATTIHALTQRLGPSAIHLANTRNPNDTIEILREESTLP